eukprot:1143905-Pelagomonas_calceolata.AAC.2
MKLTADKTSLQNCRLSKIDALSRQEQKFPYETMGSNLLRHVQEQSTAYLLTGRPQSSQAVLWSAPRQTL